jgi:hypothetical protein
MLVAANSTLTPTSPSFQVLSGPSPFTFSSARFVLSISVHVCWFMFQIFQNQKYSNLKFLKLEMFKYKIVQIQKCSNSKLFKTKNVQI